MKKLSFLLAIVLLLSACLMTACKHPVPPDAPQGTTPQVTTPEETTPEPDKPLLDPSLSISVEELINYEIIYAKDSSQEVKDEVKKLVGAIFDTFGVMLNQRTDLYYEGVESLKKGQYEILIGHTNRAESETLLSALRWDDYGYGMVGDKLVITGKNEDETLRVLRDFIERVKASAEDEKVFFNNESQCIITCDYPHPDLTVNGIPVEELSILCNEEELGGVAQIIRDAIIDASGIAVPIITDADVKEGDKLFVVGESAHITIDAWIGAGVTGNDYCIHTAEELIWIDAQTAAGYLSAAAELAMQLSGKGGDNVSFTAGKREGEDAIAVMSFNLMAGAQNGDKRVDRVISIIKKYRPAVIGVQEATDNWMNILRERLGDTYTVVGVGRNADGHDEHSAILFLTEEFELLEGGTKWLSDTPDTAGSKFAESHYTRIMTYALLSRKSDGKQFLHVNTHLDYGSTDAEEQVKVKQMQVIFNEIAKLPDVPTIITGDFNATVSSPVYDKILEEGYFDSSRVNCKNQVANTYHGLMGTTGAPSHIDYIFASAGLTDRYYRVCRERVGHENVSDHYPILSILSFGDK